MHGVLGSCGLAIGSEHPCTPRCVGGRVKPPLVTGRSDHLDLGSRLPQLVAGLTVTIIFLAVLSIVLAAAGPDGLGLSQRETSGWIVAGYGLPMLPSLFLSVRHRTPLLLTGNVFAVIFFLSLGDRFTFSELAGATLVAGATLLVLTITGTSGRLARWIPAAVVDGLIAGAVIPFVVDLFTSLSPADDGARSAIIVGSALVAYVLGIRFARGLPAVLPAFLAGIVATAATGSLGSFPKTWSLPHLELIEPTFSLAAIATVAPVVLALLTLQANFPSSMYLRSQGFTPPERTLNAVGGVGTMIASFLGPIAMSLALPPTIVMAGPSAGDHPARYRAAYLPITAGISIALLASVAAELSVLLPPVLLLGIAGLALVPALASALRGITEGPLLLGPLFAFAIALSDLTIAGLGAFFWSLVLGTLISIFLERDAWRAATGRIVAAPIADGND
jgi:benzoate membrane transport protein